jgi:hypothetical protein
MPKLGRDVPGNFDYAVGKPSLAGLEPERSACAAQEAWEQRKTWCLRAIEGITCGRCELSSSIPMPRYVLVPAADLEELTERLEALEALPEEAEDADEPEGSGDHISDERRR